MSSELTVIIKDPEKTQCSKFLLYEPYSVSESDPLIQSHIKDCISEFGREPEDITIKITLSIK